MHHGPNVRRPGRQQRHRETGGVTHEFFSIDPTVPDTEDADAYEARRLKSAFRPRIFAHERRAAPKVQPFFIPTLRGAKIFLAVAEFCFFWQPAVSVCWLTAFTWLIGGILFGVAALAGKILIGGVRALLAAVFDRLAGFGRLSTHEVMIRNRINEGVATQKRPLRAGGLSGCSRPICHRPDHCYVGHCCCLAPGQAYVRRLQPRPGVRYRPNQRLWLRPACRRLDVCQ